MIFDNDTLIHLYGVIFRERECVCYIYYSMLRIDFILCLYSLFKTLIGYSNRQNSVLSITIYEN